MVRILAVSDEVAERLDADAVRALRPDVVAGCGDVPFDVLSATG